MNHPEDVGVLISMKEWLLSIWKNFPDILWSKKTWLAVIDIAMVYFLAYRGLLFLRGTKAVRSLFGLLFLLILYLSAKTFELQTVSWIFDQFFNSFVLVLLILFQDEIRLALSRLGLPMSGSAPPPGKEVIPRLAKAMGTFSTQKIGALVIIERSASLRDWTQGGTKIDAIVSEELLYSIFLPYSPIHDGAVIIRNDRIDMAGCFLPLTQSPSVSKNLGTRHRAGIGITETTDAIVIVVSETDGKISLCLDGQISRGLDVASLTNELSSMLDPQSTNTLRQKPATDPKKRRQTGSRRRTGAYPLPTEVTPEKTTPVPPEKTSSPPEDN